jgi:hypothetical protein
MKMTVNNKAISRRRKNFDELAGRVRKDVRGVTVCCGCAEIVRMLYQEVATVS